MGGMGAGWGGMGGPGMGGMGGMGMGGMGMGGMGMGGPGGWGPPASFPTPAAGFGGAALWPPTQHIPDSRLPHGERFDTINSFAAGRSCMFMIIFRQFHSF